MPPRGGHSSSSHSSRSHSSSSRSHSSSSRSSSSSPSHKPSFCPKSIPKQVKDKATHLQCKDHDYIYYPENWYDEDTGTWYNRGYYDENNKYYNDTELVFKLSDGTYKAYFHCSYCGSNAEYKFNEGQYPNCQNCGAVMERQPSYVDELISVSRAATQEEADKSAKFILTLIFGFFFAPFIMAIPAMFIMFLIAVFTFGPANKPVQNTDIYGTVLYLDLIDESKNMYRICEESDDYEKRLTWDYGYESYYDRESDCYIWYNTDVSPNLWQYWYDDIAGDATYGWMECEDRTWYIENSKGNWDIYTGNTSSLWHIENEFDE